MEQQLGTSRIGTTVGTPGVLIVPEPSCAALLCLPALALLRRRSAPVQRR